MNVPEDSVVGNSMPLTRSYMGIWSKMLDPIDSMIIEQIGCEIDLIIEGKG